MKNASTRLAEQYVTALRRHLTAGRQGAQGTSRAAVRLGRRAVALGLETLGLAGIHERALRTLLPPGGSATSRERMIKRAKGFFAQAIAPIERTHRAALMAEIHLRQLNQTLLQRARESSTSAQELKQGILERRAAEAALKNSGKQHTRLLEESRRLQRHSQHLTHEVLSAQEAEWQRISRQLQNEIAQILLGINVRLLTLKKVAKANTANLRKEIASTQRLVRQSVKTISRFARELGLQHET